MGASVYLARGKVKPLLHRHPWVYPGSIESVEGELADGDEVDVRAPDGRFLGRGIWSGDAPIAVRLFSFCEGDRLDQALLERRLAAASRFRSAVLGLPSADTDCFRVAHAEADGLPGIVVDRLAGHAVVQLSFGGMQARRETITDAVRAALVPPPEGVWEPSAGLPGPRVSVRERGLVFQCDLFSPQKTGFYCDQRENRAFVEALSRGRRVLDLFCYTGGFSLAAARGGAVSVLGVDSSAAAVEAARANAAANGLAAEFVKADAYKLLGQLRAEGRTFDLVVADPPSYVGSRDSLRAGLQKLKELLRLAIAVTLPDGVLVACDCSGDVDEAALEETLAGAAHDTGRDLAVFRRAGQAPDHPVSLACPQGRYLKAFFCHLGDGPGYDSEAAKKKSEPLDSQG